jgi:tetratricopeptide (TPR) repeat protein/transcriptional regulator with XRE-family HTH domain
MNAGPRGSFGDLLRRHRHAAGLTQEELAERSGLSVRAVGDMERGTTTRPYLRSARMLADALMLTALARKEFFASADADGCASRQALGPAVAEMAADYAARRSAVAVERLVPRQLPAGPSHFAGRGKELAALTRLTRRPAAAPHIVISGAAGVGKTTLAVHWAQQAAEMFPDGQLYVNLGGFGPSGTPLPPTAVIRGFFAALGVPDGRIPAALDEQAALLRSLLADKRMLMLLDNARDANQVRPLLPGSGDCQVVVTSRDPLLALVAAEGAYPFRLDLLGADEARELLADRLGDRNLADEQTVCALIEACARLPLALSIAAARAASYPEFSIASLVVELQDAGDRLDALDAWDPATSVRTVFSWSYQHLTDQAARMLRLLAIHPGPDIAVPAAASLAGLPRPQARQLLAELARTQLLAEHIPGRFSCHDLLRAYAAEQLRELADDAEQQAALGRMLDHYLHTAHAADRTLYPAREPITLAPPQPAVLPEDFPDRPRASSWYQAEAQVLLAVIGQAAHATQHTYVWQLPRAMETYLIWQGQWHDLAAILRGALDATRRLGDLAGQAYSVRALGRVSALLGLHDEASRNFAEALYLFRTLDDRVGEARTHIDAGIMADREEHFSDALGHALRALALYAEADFRPGLAGALNNLGWYQTKLGDYAQALASCQKALVIFLKLGDRYGAAHSLDSLALAHRRLGGYARSIAYYQESLELFRAVGSRIDQAEVLSRLADCQHAAGDLPGAKASWQQALSMLDERHRLAAARSAPGSGRILQFKAAWRPRTAPCHGNGRGLRGNGGRPAGPFG